MFWSLLKIIIFVAAVAGLTLGAAMLLDSEEGLRIAVAGMEFNLGPLQAIIALLVLLAAMWLLLKLAGLLVATLRFINGDETAISRYFSRNRERKGYRALTDSVVALASGEPAIAAYNADKAERLLGKPELTNLISAQAAEMQGDTARAIEYYKKLLDDGHTKFAAVRGLLRQKLAQGDDSTALKLAEKAFNLKPGHDEIQQTLLRLQTKERDWTGARRTLLARKTSGALPRDVFRRRDAVLALQAAADLAGSGATEDAQDAAIEANGLSPDLVPAAAAAARAHIARGATGKAYKLLRKAWAVNPHPELAAAFADLVPTEDARARLERFRPLVAQKPDHPESRMLEAELLIAAEDFPAARRAIRDLVDKQPDARVLTIMAAIERGEGSDDAVVRGWLTRALTAPDGPKWVCESCHNIQNSWSAVCTNCSKLDTLSWRAPDVRTGPSPTQTEMLPLIVGTPASAVATKARDASEAEPQRDTGAGVGAEATSNIDMPEPEPSAPPSADMAEFDEEEESLPRGKD